MNNAIGNRGQVREFVKAIGHKGEFSADVGRGT